ncbi:MAG: hypothetical protein GY716_09585 [bacterium]|nr:hypothetical protein [bacterium]
MPRRTPTIVGLCFLVCVASLSCDPGRRTAQEAILPYLEAVQAEDLDRLFCLSAGAATSGELGADPEARRAGFEAWAAAHYELYLEGRDAGFIALEDSGILATKLFSLGRGTFYTLGLTEQAGEGGLRIPMHLRFGYSQVDLSRLPPGTTFYFSGSPPGSVLPLQVPHGAGEFSLDVLERLTLEWSLVESAPAGDCPAGWAVAAVDVVEGSAETVEVTWMF